VAAVRAGIEAAGGAVDYVSVVSRDDLQPLASLDDAPAVCLVAATFGTVRLLDNMELD
jgi:pantothenate synthetase